MPRNPPNSDEKKICQKLISISGYLAWRMYSPGMVKTAPATMTPEEAPMDWMMTFLS